MFLTKPNHNFYLVFTILFVFIDLEFLIFYFNFLFLHIFYGMISILKDYVHFKKLFMLLNFLIRFLVLNLTILLTQFFF